MTIKEAVKAAMDDWASQGTTSVEAMLEQVQWLVEEATLEWAAEHPEFETQ